MKFFTQEGQVAFINAVTPYFIMVCVIVLSVVGGYTASFSVPMGSFLILFATLVGVSYSWFRENVVKATESTSSS